jgi:hypothetical protein
MCLQPSGGLMNAKSKALGLKWNRPAQKDISATLDLGDLRCTCTEIITRYTLCMLKHTSIEEREVKEHLQMREKCETSVQHAFVFDHVHYITTVC